MDVCCECCALSGRGLCDELITRPEKSYRLWSVVVCDLETSCMRRPWSTGGCCAKNKNGNGKQIKINKLINQNSRSSKSCKYKTIFIYSFLHINFNLMESIPFCLIIDMETHYSIWHDISIVIFKSYMFRWKGSSSFFYKILKIRRKKILLFERSLNHYSVYVTVIL
jgi:hypothetical protein